LHKVTLSLKIKGMYLLVVLCSTSITLPNDPFPMTLSKIKSSILTISPLLVNIYSVLSLLRAQN